VQKLAETCRNKRRVNGSPEIFGVIGLFLGTCYVEENNYTDKGND
jgi:hypothetical protein